MFLWFYFIFDNVYGTLGTSKLLLGKESFHLTSFSALYIYIYIYIYIYTYIYTYTSEYSYMYIEIDYQPLLWINSIKLFFYP
jgi:hypothetical protein